MSSRIGSAILSKVKDYALHQAKKFANQNMSHGVVALDFIDKDIQDLLLQAQEYHGFIIASTEAMRSDRASSSDYLTTCNKVLSSSEVETVQQIIDEVRKLSDFSSDLEARAIQRVRSQKISLRQALDRKTTALERMEKHNGSPEQVSRASSRIRAAVNDFDNYRLMQFQINARGDSLRQICAVMIALLVSIKETLRDNHDDFIYFSRDCMQWSRFRRTEGIY